MPRRITLGELRVDPWSVEYDPPVAFDPVLAEPTVDETIEFATWTPLPVGDPGPVSEVFYIDGTRRVEPRIVASADTEPVYGLLGSFGVGAARLGGGRAELFEPVVERRAPSTGETKPPFTSAPCHALRVFR